MSLGAYAIVVEGDSNKRLRRWLALDAVDGALTLHQSQRSANAGKAAILTIPADCRTVSPDADDDSGAFITCKSVKLFVHFDTMDEVSAWKEALSSNAVAVAAAAEDPAQQRAATDAAEEEEEEDSSPSLPLRHSQMETVAVLDLKSSRMKRATSLEAYKQEDAARTDDQRSLLKMLFDACARGDDADDIAELVEGLPDANGVDASGRSALHIAAANGHDELVAKLLECGASVDLRTYGGQTAAMAAAEKGHAEALASLLEAKATIDGAAEGETCFHLASQYGHLECIEALLAAGFTDAAHLDRTSSTLGGTALQLAALRTPQQVEVARRLLEAKASCDVHSAAALGELSALEGVAAERLDTRESRGCTPLFFAARAGQLSAVELLIGSGVTVDALDDRKSTPLHGASDEGHAAVVEALLAAAGAPSGDGTHGVGHQNEDGETALQLASKRGHVGIVRSLVAATSGARAVNKCDRHGACALLLAAAGGHDEVVSTLLGVDALKIDTRDKFGCTALTVAAATGRTALVEALLAAKADPNRGDNARETPLMVAALHGMQEVVDVLLGTRGVDVNAANEFGETALMLAVGEHLAPIAKALIGHGAALDTPDDVGRTALMRAVAQAYEEPSRRRSLGWDVVRQHVPAAIAVTGAFAQAVSGGPGVSSPTQLGSPGSPGLAIASPAAAPAVEGKKKKGKDSPGQSPGTKEWLQSSLAMIKLLVEGGATLTIRDQSGDDALALATGAPSIVKYLRGKLPKDYGKEPSSGSSPSGRSPPSGSTRRFSLKAGMAMTKVTANSASKLPQTPQTPPADTGVHADQVVPTVADMPRADGSDPKALSNDEMPTVGGGCCTLQ